MLGRRREVSVNRMVARIAALVGRTIMFGLDSSRALGLLVMTRSRRRGRLVLLVRDMGVGTRVAMFVLAIVLLDVPRWNLCYD
jgi:hypothetical protein